MTRFLNYRVIRMGTFGRVLESTADQSEVFEKCGENAKKRDQRQIRKKKNKLEAHLSCVNNISKIKIPINILNVLAQGLKFTPDNPYNPKEHL